MARTATLKKIGQRLEQGLKRKQASVREAMTAIGGRTLPTWYRWINGQQEGGCRDMTELGLFLGLTPNQLFLDDEEPSTKSALNEADLVAIENLKAMIDEMTVLSQAKNPEDRPAALVARHCHDLLSILRSKSKKTKGK